MILGQYDFDTYLETAIATTPCVWTSTTEATDAAVIYDLGEVVNISRLAIYGGDSEYSFIMGLSSSNRAIWRYLPNPLLFGTTIQHAQSDGVTLLDIDTHARYIYLRFSQCTGACAFGNVVFDVVQPPAVLNNVTINEGELSEPFRPDGADYTITLPSDVEMLSMEFVGDHLYTLEASVNGEVVQVTQDSDSSRFNASIFMSTISDFPAVLEVTADSPNHSPMQYRFTIERTVNIVPSSYIKPNAIQSEDMFGHAMDYDGETLVVSTFNNRDAMDSSQVIGAVDIYIPTSDGESWTHLQRIEGAAGSGFGNDVAIANELLIVGAPTEIVMPITTTEDEDGMDEMDGVGEESATNTGRVYVYIRNEDRTEWTLLTTMDAQASGNNGIRFGESVGIDSAATVVAIGDPGLNEEESGHHGRVDVFIKGVDVDTGEVTIGFSQSVSRSGHHARVGEGFGDSIALNQSFLMVAAPHADFIQNTEGETSYDGLGAVYIFEKNTRTNLYATNFTLLTPSSPTEGQFIGQNFGHDIALDGNILIVGSPSYQISSGTMGTMYNSIEIFDIFTSGSVHVYEFTSAYSTSDEEVWRMQQYIRAPEPEPADRFGFSVSLYEGSFIAASRVSTPQLPLSAQQGQVSLYTLSENEGENQESAWEYNTFVRGINAENDDQFGADALLHDDKILVTATGEDGDLASSLEESNNNLSNSGVLYIYSIERDEMVSDTNADDTNDGM